MEKTQQMHYRHREAIRGKGQVYKQSCPYLGQQRSQLDSSIYSL